MEITFVLQFGNMRHQEIACTENFNVFALWILGKLNITDAIEFVCKGFYNGIAFFNPTLPVCTIFFHSYPVLH